MSAISRFLRQDWQRAREALHQQIDAFESGWAGPSLTGEQRAEITRHLVAAIGEYDLLLARFTGVAEESAERVAQDLNGCSPVGEHKPRARRKPDHRRFGFDAEASPRHYVESGACRLAAD